MKKKLCGCDIFRRLLIGRMAADLTFIAWLPQHNMLNADPLFQVGDQIYKPLGLGSSSRGSAASSTGSAYACDKGLLNHHAIVIDVFKQIKVKGDWYIVKIAHLLGDGRGVVIEDILPADIVYWDKVRYGLPGLFAKLRSSWDDKQSIEGSDDPEVVLSRVSFLKECAELPPYNVSTSNW